MFSKPLIRPYGHLLPEGEGFISSGEVVETVILDKEPFEQNGQNLFFDAYSKVLDSRKNLIGSENKV